LYCRLPALHPGRQTALAKEGNFRYAKAFTIIDFRDKAHDGQTHKGVILMDDAGSIKALKGNPLVIFLRLNNKRLRFLCPANIQPMAGCRAVNLQASLAALTLPDCIEQTVVEVLQVPGFAGAPEDRLRGYI